MPQPCRPQHHAAGDKGQCPDHPHAGVQLAGRALHIHLVLEIQRQQAHRDEGKRGQQQHLAAHACRPGGVHRQLPAQALGHDHRQCTRQHQAQQVETQRMGNAVRAQPGHRMQCLRVVRHRRTEAGHRQHEQGCGEHAHPTIQPNHGHRSHSPEEHQDIVAAAGTCAKRPGIS
ncbi:hypothetical protein D3C73_973620 [compost metagenome]